MNDTVTRLMELADAYSNAGPYPFNAYKIAREALQDELQKLFTPLNAEQEDVACSAAATRNMLRDGGWVEYTALGVVGAHLSEAKEARN